MNALQNNMLPFLFFEMGFAVCTSFGLRINVINGAAVASFSSLFGRHFILYNNGFACLATKMLLFGYTHIFISKTKNLGQYYKFFKSSDLSTWRL